MTGERLPAEAAAMAPEPGTDVAAAPPAVAESEAIEAATATEGVAEAAAPVTDNESIEATTTEAATTSEGEATPSTEPPPAAAAPAPAATSAAPGVRLGRTRRAVRRVRPVVTVALFVIGVVLGWAAFQATRPLTAPGSIAIEDVSASTRTPPAVQDLVGALNSDDQTAVRAVLDSEPYRLLAGELASMNFQTIDGVDTLSTYTHDNLSATEIVIRGETSEGGLIAINLVVHQKDDVIVSFR